MKGPAVLFLTRLRMTRVRLRAALSRAEVRRLRRRLFFRGMPVQRYYLQLRIAGRYANSPDRWITITTIEGWTRLDADIAARSQLGAWAGCPEDYRLVAEGPR